LTAILLNLFLREFNFQNNFQNLFKKYFWTQFPYQFPRFCQKDGQKDVLESTKNSDNEVINQTLNHEEKFNAGKVFASLNFMPIILFLILGSVLSFGSNISKTWDYGQTKFGQKRLTSTQDMVETLKKLPENSKICLPKINQKASLDYLSLFVVKKNQQIYLCSEKMTEFIFWEKWSGWKMTENQKPIDLKILPVFYQIGNIEILHNVL
jgi:tricorn protease-like protein